MLRLFSINKGLIREISSPKINKMSDFVQAQWVDSFHPNNKERELLKHLLHAELPESEEVEEIEASARFFVDHSGIHVHSLFLSQSEGRHKTVSVAFILQTNRLISIRDDELADFRLLRMRARNGQVNCLTPAELLVTILEQKVENLADNLEEIHCRLETVSHFVLEEDSTDLEQAIGNLARLEDSNGKIRLCLMDTQRDLSFLDRHLRDQVDLQETILKTMRDIETLMSHTTFLFDKINFLMDSTQGFINIQQNQIIKIFSIAAVVFLPPTLVASIYGMNFRFIPELEWVYGYPGALGLMVLSGVAPYILFKRKGWL